MLQLPSSMLKATPSHQLLYNTCALWWDRYYRHCLVTEGTSVWCMHSWLATWEPLLYASSTLAIQSTPKLVSYSRD
jgi:hypothetical protein